MEEPSYNPRPETPPPVSGGSEKEPFKRFRVEIKDPKGIYELLQRGGSTWDEAPLDGPFRDIHVRLRTKGKLLEAVASFSEVIDFPRLNKEIDSAYLKERYQTDERGENLFVLDEKGVREWQIPKRLFLLGLTGGFGVTPDPISGHGFAQPKELGNPEEFERRLRKFAQLTEDVVVATYRGVGYPVPEETLVIGAKKEEERGVLEGLLPGKLSREALLSRIEIEKPTTSFAEIGGQKEAKREVQGLAFALKNPELYKKWGTRPPKGVLLTGPPGTGKTLLVRALAAEAEARMFHIEVSDIVSKWYGEAEQLMKMVFEEASRNKEKTILFFDELDAIAPYRTGAHEATARIVSTLLENLSGLEDNPDVLFVAATNRPEAIDSALLRPGRIDRIVEVPLPDEEGRKEIFEIHKKKAEAIAERNLFAELDMEKIVSKTDRFSGADIEELIRRTLEERVRREGMGEEPGLVTTEDVLRMLESYEKIRRAKERIGFVK